MRSCATIPRPYGLEAPVTLSEVLDRVLNTGAVVSGEIVISVAGIDLLYLGLNLMVSSVETVRRDGPLARRPGHDWRAGAPSFPGESHDESQDHA